MTLNLASHSFIRVAALFVASGAAVLAQMGPSCTFTGSVYTMGAAAWSGEMLVVEPLTGGEVVFRTFIHSDGSFEIRNVPGGTYRVSLLDGQGELLWRDILPIGAGTMPLR